MRLFSSNALDPASPKAPSSAILHIYIYIYIYILYIYIYVDPEAKMVIPAKGMYIPSSYKERLGCLEIQLVRFGKDATLLW